MARPLSFTPEAGPVLTLSDLRDFVAEAYAKGFPDDATPRVTGALGGLNLTHGPLAARITLVPGEEADRD